MADLLPTLLAFLRGIGLRVEAGEVPAEAFLPGVRIVQGGLVFDPQALRWPGDLLHEAGHLATTPGAARAGLDDRLEGASSPVGEVEAIAWSYAAVRHLGLDPRVLFHPEGYQGRSEALLLAFAHGVYPGAAGLSQAGLTAVGAAAQAAGLPPYPHMLRWLRP